MELFTFLHVHTALDLGGTADKMTLLPLVKAEEVRIAGLTPDSPQGENKLFKKKRSSAEAKVMMENGVTTDKTNFQANDSKEAGRQTQCKRKIASGNVYCAMRKPSASISIFQQNRHKPVLTCVIFSSRR